MWADRWVLADSATDGTFLWWPKIELGLFVMQGLLNSSSRSFFAWSLNTLYQSKHIECKLISLSISALVELAVDIYGWWSMLTKISSWVLIFRDVVWWRRVGGCGRLMNVLLLPKAHLSASVKKYHIVLSHISICAWCNWTWWGLGLGSGVEVTKVE